MTSSSAVPQPSFGAAVSKNACFHPELWLFVSQLGLGRLWLMFTCLRGKTPLPPTAISSKRSFYFTNVFALPRLGFISHTIVPARITISF
ncbi:hypothetical protein I7I53_09319 [Histoplasma capsulatum var. duboisii H88]|uniref:Uncharacterized protein n=1 Tax=Ajellomyces capsulatus (strain H88) TaxID=544711 RepID=A0A8A1L9E2_AJEC8|nr:hypothetical protein I7I53_09319 [Histoplasma capsulatum var. duboisii H88]